VKDGCTARKRELNGILRGIERYDTRPLSLCFPCPLRRSVRLKIYCGNQRRRGLEVWGAEIRRGRPCRGSACPTGPGARAASSRPSGASASYPPCHIPVHTESSSPPRVTILRSSHSSSFFPVSQAPRQAPANLHGVCSFLSDNRRLDNLAPTQRLASLRQYIAFALAKAHPVTQLTGQFGILPRPACTACINSTSISSSFSSSAYSSLCRCRLRIRGRIIQVKNRVSCFPSRPATRIAIPSCNC